MAREGHRRGQEADELAALSRALREAAAAAATSAQGAIRSNADVQKAVATPAVAAAAAAAEPHGERKAPKEKKQKKRGKEEEKKERNEKKKKRKQPGSEDEQTATGGAPAPLATAAAPPAAACSGVPPTAEALFPRLQATAAQLRVAAVGGDQFTAAWLRQALSELLACVAQLNGALAAAAAQPPAALRLLQGQAEAMQPPQAPPQLAALGVQADAAAAAARRCLAEAGTAAGAAAALDAPLQPAEQAGFRRWFLPRFADCYAAEVEALQDSEPPIPAGVLLQCVRLAADGDALFSPALKRLVLSAGDAA